MKHCPRAVSIARPSTLQPTALPSEHIAEGCCCIFSNPFYTVSCFSVEPFSSASSENVYKTIIRMSMGLVCVVLWHQGPYSPTCHTTNTHVFVVLFCRTTYYRILEEIVRQLWVIFVVHSVKIYDTSRGVVRQFGAAFCLLHGHDGWGSKLCGTGGKVWNVLTRVTASRSTYAEIKKKVTLNVRRDKNTEKVVEKLGNCIGGRTAGCRSL